MDVYEVFSRRTIDDPLTHVGAIKAPDSAMALVLARESFFRHGEGVDCWIVRRGDMHRVAHPETLGGVGDKTYRRKEGYMGIGAKHKAVSARLADIRIDAPRPGVPAAPPAPSAASPTVGQEH